jgi:hypothetical protein
MFILNEQKLSIIEQNQRKWHVEILFEVMCLWRELKP